MTNNKRSDIIDLSNEREVIDMAKFKIKYFQVESDEIADNGGISIVTSIDDWNSFSEILENMDENIIISIERQID